MKDDVKEIKNIINLGENVNTEFKEAVGMLESSDYKNIVSDVNSDEIKLILNEIKKNNKITLKELSIKMNLKLKTLERRISVLKEKGYIQREGSKRAGYWKY